MNFYQEAVLLASRAYYDLRAIGYNDPLFQRYIELQDYEFVKGESVST